MGSPLSPIITPSGAHFGKDGLVERLRAWLTDERVMRLQIKHGPSSTLELALLHRDLPKMKSKGLARVTLWLLKHRLVRLAIARSMLKAGEGSRHEVKAALTELRIWAEREGQRSGLILPS